MKHSLQAVRVGVFFVLGLALIYTVYTVIGNNALSEEKGYVLEATFNDVKTLTTGTDVRMAGVRIGSVREIDLIEGKGRLMLRIEEDTSIPADSVAMIGVASLLGQNYISIEYGSPDAPPLQDGDPITVKPSVDFNDIMSDIGELGAKLNDIADTFSGVGGDGMNSLFTNLNDLVTANRAEVDSIIANLDRITQSLSSGEGTIGKLLTDETAYNELVAMVREIQGAADDTRALIAEANGIVEGVKSGEGTIGRLLYDDSIADELTTAVANIRAFSDQLNSGDGTLGKLVTDDSLYQELRAMLNKADQALDSVGDSGPVSAVGAAAGVLF